MQSLSLIAGRARHVLGEEHAGRSRGDRLELAANFRRRVGLGVERLVVRRAAVEPDQDARRRLGRLARRALGVAGFGDSAAWPASRSRSTSPPPAKPAEAELQAVAAREAFAVAHRSVIDAATPRQFLNMNSGVFSRAHNKSSAVSRCFVRVGGEQRRPPPGVRRRSATANRSPNTVLRRSASGDFVLP